MNCHHACVLKLADSPEQCTSVQTKQLQAALSKTPPFFPLPTIPAQKPGPASLPESESFWSPLAPTVKGSFRLGAFSFMSLMPSLRSNLGVLFDEPLSLSWGHKTKKISVNVKLIKPIRVVLYCKHKQLGNNIWQQKEIVFCLFLILRTNITNLNR